MAQFESRGFATKGPALVTATSPVSMSRMSIFQIERGRSSIAQAGRKAAKLRRRRMLEAEQLQL
jgi:hypothetical protein